MINAHRIKSKWYEEMAIADFEKSSKLNPKDPEPHFQLASIYSPNVHTTTEYKSRYKANYHYHMGLQLNPTYEYLAAYKDLADIYRDWEAPQDLDYSKKALCTARNSYEYSKSSYTSNIFNAMRKNDRNAYEPESDRNRLNLV